jgi:hypothetical protein
VDRRVEPGHDEQGKPTNHRSRNLASGDSAIQPTAIGGSDDDAVRLRGLTTLLAISPAIAG